MNQIRRSNVALWQAYLLTELERRLFHHHQRYFQDAFIGLACEENK
jgi:hypothetical protein